MALVTRFTAQAALAATICWAIVLALTGASDALLYMAPALLVALPLLGGRYVGEDLIVRLVERRARRARRARSVSQPVPQAPAVWGARGARLIAFSRAERPPPAWAPAHS